MDKIDKGAKCPKEGQDAVNTMQGRLTAAQNDKKAKDKAYNDAMNADVNFGTRKFNSLTKGQCGTFFNSAADKNAAKIAVRKCQCSTYKAHEKALSDSNAKVK